MKEKTTTIKLKRFALMCLATLGLSQQLSAQATPEVLYYRFDGTGTSVPNLASAPPAGTATATIMGSLSQGAGGFCQGALIGSGNASSTDYLNTNWAPNLAAGSWTVSMYTKDITASTTLFYIFGDANTTSFRCFTNGVAGPNNWILRGPITDILVPGGATVAPHVTTFVYDAAAGFTYGYLDGALVATVAQGAVNLTGTGPLKVIGYGTNVGAPFGGKVDEFRFYSRALTAAEVLELSNIPNSYGSITTAICQNDSYTVPSGDTAYTATGTYTDTIASLIGCADSVITINLTVNPLPTPVANASDDFLCAGESTTLFGSGAASYTWSGSVTDNVAFTPSSTATYTVSSTDVNGCTNVDSITVVVNALPTVYGMTNTPTICLGDSAQVYGIGAETYTWDNGVMDSVMFAPTSTIVYGVTGTDTNGCVTMNVVTVTVNSLPTVTASSSVAAVCEGDNATLTGSGASTYTWTGGAADGVAFPPVATATYTVTGTDANGCVDTDTVSVIVNPSPTVTLSLGSTMVCVYTSAFTLTGESPAGGIWTGTGVTGSTFDPATAGAGTYAIDYMYADGLGCTAFASDSITVDLCLGITASTEANSFNVYPNPTAGEFTIEFGQAPETAVIIEVSNSVGQVVNSFQMTSISTKVDLSELSNGLYSLKVISGNNVNMKRIVKN